MIKGNGANSVDTPIMKKWSQVLSLTIDRLPPEMTDTKVIQS